MRPTAERADPIQCWDGVNKTVSDPGHFGGYRRSNGVDYGLTATVLVAA